MRLVNRVWMYEYIYFLKSTVTVFPLEGDINQQTRLLVIRAHDYALSVMVIWYGNFGVESAYDSIAWELSESTPRVDFTRQIFFNTQWEKD